jgi:hypothetical protein
VTNALPSCGVCCRYARADVTAGTSNDGQVGIQDKENQVLDMITALPDKAQPNLLIRARLSITS